MTRPVSKQIRYAAAELCAVAVEIEDMQNIQIHEAVSRLKDIGERIGRANTMLINAIIDESDRFRDATDADSKKLLEKLRRTPPFDRFDSNGNVRPEKQPLP